MSTTEEEAQFATLLLQLNTGLSPEPAQDPQASSPAVSIPEGPRNSLDEDEGLGIILLSINSSLARPANRRQCSRSSSHSDSDPVPSKRQRLENLKLYAEEQASLLGLSEENTIDIVENFSQLDDIPKMLISMRASMYSTVSGASDASAHFIQSAEYKNHVKPRISIFMLAPGAQSYVHKAAERLVDDMRSKRAVWKIPKDVVESETEWARFSMQIGRELTSIRYKIKKKIFDSKVDNVSLQALMLSIKPGAMEINTSHLVRLAFLRSLVEEATTQKKDGEKFWQFVDSKLELVRAGCQKASQDTEVQQKLLTVYFTTIFQSDVKKYMGLRGTSSKAAVNLPQWQIDIEACCTRS